MFNSNFLASSLRNKDAVAPWQQRVLSETVAESDRVTAARIVEPKFDSKDARLRIDERHFSAGAS